MRKTLVAALALLALSLESPGNVRAMSPCPEGSEIVGDPPPAGRERYCAIKSKDGQQIKHGPYEMWYPDGQQRTEGRYTKGLKDGHFTTWYRTGMVHMKESYVEGYRDGVFETLFANGFTKERAQYKMGKLDGPYQIYYQNGNPKRECFYANGLLSGEMTAWYQNGTKRASAVFKDGKVNGPYVSWYPDGNRKVEGTFDHGKRSGTWSQWRADGTLGHESEFEDGRLVSDRKGEPKPPDLNKPRRLVKDAAVVTDEDISRKFAREISKQRKAINEQRRKDASNPNVIPEGTMEEYRYREQKEVAERKQQDAAERKQLREENDGLVHQMNSE